MLEATTNRDECPHILSEDYRSYVVYHFNCKEVGCNSSYVGYTTNTLRTRIMQHRYKPSKIWKHYTMDHKSPPTAEIANCFKILFQVGNFNYLRIAESLFIKKLKPDINVKFNEMNECLNVF